MAALPISAGAFPDNNPQFRISGTQFRINRTHVYALGSGGPARSRTAYLFGAKEALCPVSYRPRVPAPVSPEAGIQLSDGEGVNSPQAAARALSAVPAMTTSSPERPKERARTGPS